MASLNTSTNGVSISRTHQAIVDAPLPTGASASPTYAQWAVFSVQAPLANAFQPDSNKESVLKVQSSGDGELADFIDEFSDGRMQFGFAKVKDPNSGLPKNVMIGWCGEGVPERNKGYFTSHMNVVSKLLQGYHVQITARNESNLTPEGIVQKVADASGSKYTGDVAKPAAASGPPPVASKPVFTPSRVAGGVASFNPLASQPARAADSNDGWGDAEDVSRSTLQPVQSAYKPTKVDMASLTSQRQESRFQAPEPQSTPGVVKGGYQPIGKVDINAIRKQAAQSGSAADDRPTIVKGAYEPVGKVDIAAIRAKAAAAPPSHAPAPAQAESDAPDDRPKSLAERSAAFSSSGADAERITSLPKPKVANRFGATTSSFAGTKAPLPTGGAQPPAAAAPVGIASRTFADQGGKTPAQLWAEKKAQQGGAVPVPVPLASKPVEAQTSGGWQSGYTGKKWGAVDTVKPPGSGAHADEAALEQEQEQEPESEPSAGFGSIRDRFKDTAPIGAAPPSTNFSAPPPPALDTSSKPNAGAARGVPMPGLPTRTLPQHDETDVPVMPPPPAQPPRSPAPPSPVEPDSPIRIAQPVAHTHEKPLEPTGGHDSEPPIPTASIARAVPREEELTTEPPVEEQDPARAAGAHAAAATFGAGAVAAADPGAAVGGKSARAEYDYEKAEDNELELKEGEIVTNIDMVDEDWWMGQNSRGEVGLFPSNYVELLPDDDAAAAAPAAASHAAAAPAPPAAAPAPAGADPSGPAASAEYDYEAAEDNELSFPEGATIEDISFPDDDWWFGHYNGKSGLFPANYVKLHE